MFHRFTAFEAMDKTVAAGGKVIELYPGQMLSPDEPTTKVVPTASDETIAKLKAKAKQCGLLIVNFGVVDIPKDEAGARQVFEFAKKLGARAITIEPTTDQMDMIEKLVKEYNISAGIHCHPHRAAHPDYKLWDPNYVFSLVKGRDTRLGVCADVGHWTRSGVDAVAALKLFEGRVISVHLKDIPESGNPDSPDVVLGLGVTNVRGILRELRRQKFDGNISIEYERDWANSVPDIAQCIGYVRGFADAEDSK
jgi:sugar phosphate isomerase/epimerase